MGWYGDLAAAHDRIEELEAELRAPNSAWSIALTAQKRIAELEAENANLRDELEAVEQVAQRWIDYDEATSISENLRCFQDWATAENEWNRSKRDLEGEQWKYALGKADARIAELEAALRKLVDDYPGNDGPGHLDVSGAVVRIARAALEEE